MGGGPSTFAIKSHLKAGFPVYATEQAALTINDNIEKVKAFGIQIVSEAEAKKTCIRRECTGNCHAGFQSGIDFGCAFDV